MLQTKGLLIPDKICFVWFSLTTSAPSWIIYRVKFDNCWFPLVQILRQSETNLVIALSCNRVAMHWLKLQCIHLVAMHWLSCNSLIEIQFNWVSIELQYIELQIATVASWNCCRLFTENIELETANLQMHSNMVIGWIEYEMYF